MAVASPLGFSLPIDIEIPDAMMTLAELVPPIQSLTDGIVSLAIAEQAKTGKTVSCQAGCSACCYQLIPLSVPEALYLMAHIRHFPKQRQMKTIDRFQEVYRAVTDHNLVEKLNAIDDDKSKPEGLSIGRDYFELGIPCPFLEDQSCTIHEIRPIVCREYNVFSEPKKCIDPYNNEIEPINLFDSRVNVLADIASRVLGQPQELVSMPLIFDWYQENHHLSKVARHAEFLFEELFLKIIGQKHGKLSHKPKKPTRIRQRKAHKRRRAP